LSISGNYAQPDIVNGYVCWNCQQVSEAKKDINPATATQPGGAASQSGATNPGGPSGSSNASPQSAVVFGGALAQMVANGTAGPSPATAATSLASASSVGVNIFA
jgi:hypothetical protein